MSEPYEELIEGVMVQRPGPGVRHELICERLHQAVLASVAHFPGATLLARRSQVEISSEIILCPDLALVTAATGKLWLAVEVISSDDHRTDTVMKKQIYEDIKVPRLWMVDPRYDNVEIYHASSYGLALKSILAGRETVTEKLLPEFQIGVAELFKQEE